MCAIDRPEVRLVQATASDREGDLLLWLNNQATDEVTTASTFPDIAVRAARVGNVFEGSQDAVPVADGSVRISLKPGETKALALDSGAQGLPFVTPPENSPASLSFRLRRTSPRRLRRSRPRGRPLEQHRFHRHLA